MVTQGSGLLGPAQCVSSLQNVRCWTAPMTAVWAHPQSDTLIHGSQAPVRREVLLSCMPGCLVLQICKLEKSVAQVTFRAFLFTLLNQVSCFARCGSFKVTVVHPLSIQLFQSLQTVAICARRAVLHCWMICAKISSVSTSLTDCVTGRIGQAGEQRQSKQNHTSRTSLQILTSYREGYRQVRSPIIPGHALSYQISVLLV